MKGFIGGAAGVASLLLFRSLSSRRATARPALPPPAPTAVRTLPATGSSPDRDLASSNGEGSYGGLLLFMRFSSKQ
jgi:hypothetical protein